MIALPAACALTGAILPFTGPAPALGFSTLPLQFFLILAGMTAGYLVLVEAAKTRFYATQAHPHRPPTTHEQRHHRRVHRRASRFTHHPPAAQTANPPPPEPPGPPAGHHHTQPAQDHGRRRPLRRPLHPTAAAEP